MANEALTHRAGYVPSATLVVVVTAGLCGMALLRAPDGAPPSWLLFLGRFHVALIHSPIGLIVGLAAVEIAHGMRTGVDLRPASWILLWLTALTAALAVVLGTLLALAGGYDDHLLRWHRIAGTAMAVLVFWALALRLRHRAKGGAANLAVAHLCLAGAIAAAVPAGHFGGSLTHGSGYLVRYMPSELRSLIGATTEEAPPPNSTPQPPPRTAAPGGTDPSPSSPPLAFADRVLPILVRYCVSCHGPDKQQSALRTDSLAALLEGGYEGPAVVPGDPAQSLLVEVLQLPLSDDLHMPPEGKPQPTPEEIALIAAWIAEGASDTQSAADLEAAAGR